MARSVHAWGKARQRDGNHRLAERFGSRLAIKALLLMGDSRAIPAILCDRPRRGCGGPLHATFAKLRVSGRFGKSFRKNAKSR